MQNKKICDKINMLYNNKWYMISKILKKYAQTNKKKKLLVTIIEALHINENQKNLYLESLDYLDMDWLDKLYESLQVFIWEIEMKNYEEITKNNFTKIAWMRKKEAIEKQKDLNSFWFLLNNL